MTFTTATVILMETHNGTVTLKDSGLVRSLIYVIRSAMLDKERAPYSVKVHCIKLVRSSLGIGLREAKDFVEVAAEGIPEFMRRPAIQ